jgi:hypothetical protein
VHLLWGFPSGIGRKRIVTPMKQDGGGGVMFWACMTRRVWGPLTTVEGTINGDKYLQLLKSDSEAEVPISIFRLVGYSLVNIILVLSIFHTLNLVFKY